jgi:soluble cytochrome b562
MKPQGAEKAQGVGQANQVQHAQQAQKIDHARQIDNVGKLDKTGLQKTDKNMTGKGMDPVTQKQEVSKSKSMIMDMMGNMEKGQVSIDKLINGGLTGKNFSNTEMLGLQAGMYKYSQELDLCSKVVEKATSGLKDTLKTQV